MCLNCYLTGSKTVIEAVHKAEEELQGWLREQVQPMSTANSQDLAVDSAVLLLAVNIAQHTIHNRVWSGFIFCGGTCCRYDICNGNTGTIFKVDLT